MDDRRGDVLLTSDLAQGEPAVEAQQQRRSVRFLELQDPARELALQREPLDEELGFLAAGCQLMKHLSIPSPALAAHALADEVADDAGEPAPQTAAVVWTPLERNDAGVLGDVLRQLGIPGDLQRERSQPVELAQQVFGLHASRVHGSWIQDAVLGPLFGSFPEKPLRTLK